ncbi:MAG: twin-arginine translocase subunit TatC [Deltaproteobacteria bacterium]|nr:twin-arginine translocase subunit TatC [Deltaproteobacteria bacterium]
MAEEGKMPFTSHLEELRSRLIKCFLAIGVGFFASYHFHEKIFNLLMMPLLISMPKGQDKLIFTGLAEAFITYLKVSFIAGLFFASPVIFYQFWKFVTPGLYKNEKKYIVGFVIFSSVFFVGGASFGYFIVFPYAFKYLMSFANQNIQALPSIKEYLSFSMKLLISFGAVFELPLVAFFLAKVGLLTDQFLRDKRKYAIVIAFIVAAILTPPDVISQCMMAIPILILYEISVIVVKVVCRNKRRREESDLEEPAEEDKVVEVP